MNEQIKKRKNSIGVEMIEIQPGTFMMGASEEDKDALWDEKPIHPVEITYTFEMSNTEITNKQYEEFDPEHRKERGDGGGTGFSVEDTEAVVNVSRKEALEFCRWLSETEGKHYRLPTEAEWEYACRAGTQTRYFTGNFLSQEFQKDQKLTKKWNAKQFYKDHTLKVQDTPANQWGLYEMHGNVENWCMDRFKYYTKAKEKDPIALGNNQVEGNAYVTRGGSFGVKAEHLRSSRRFGALEGEKNWLIGFRVVCGPRVEDLNEGGTRKPLNSYCISGVSQAPYNWKEEKEKLKNQPIYKEPIPYIKPPRETDKIQVFPHNHCPAITYCDNGDILGVWFSTHGEHDRDMIILGSRLRKGHTKWDPGSLFFRIPGRNMTGSALYNDDKGTLYHFNGLEVATSWKTLAMLMRTSKDNGATWSSPRFIEKRHQWRNQVISGTFQSQEGDLIQLCDATPKGSGGTAFWRRKKRGGMWRDMGRTKKGKLREKPHFWRNKKGAWIAGIHAKAVQLNDGSYMALGRANNKRKGLKWKMPKSISRDGGKNWEYSPSSFPPISYGQRLVLLRLQEGPLFFASFTGAVRTSGRFMYWFLNGMKLPTLSGEEKKCYGLFAAISRDEGKSWPIRRFLPLNNPKNARKQEGFGIRRDIIVDDRHGELKGYLAGIQTPNGMIHVLSSKIHYRFNLPWLMEHADP